MSQWPEGVKLGLQDVIAAQKRIRPYLAPTPLRHYRELDEAVGHGIRVLVKHENHQPTNAFKVRNGLSVLTTLDRAQKRRGVIGATRGNHGQGLAWAGALLGIPVTICVPRGNSPGKNAAMRGFGAELIEEGKDYDESVTVAERLVAERGLRMVHSTNNPDIIAGAGTITLELVDQAARQRESLDAMVVAVGGGSQAVGAITVLREHGALAEAQAQAGETRIPVYGVQAAKAAAMHDSWHAGQRLTVDSADTFADGLATRSTYDATYAPLCRGLRDFVKVSEGEIAEAIRVFMRTTHNLAEGAGAAGLAGLCELAPRLEGKTVAVILSGSNLDLSTLRAVLNHEIA